jgi:hypothetical protein
MNKKENIVVTLFFVLVFHTCILFSAASEITSEDLHYIRRQLDIALADMSDSDLKLALQAEYYSGNSNADFILNTLKTIEIGKTAFSNGTGQTSLQKDMINFYARLIEDAIYAIGKQLGGGKYPNFTNTFISIGKICGELLRIRIIQNNNLAYTYYALIESGLTDSQSWTQITTAIKEGKYEDLAVSGNPSQFPPLGRYNEEELDRLYVFVKFVYHAKIIAENEEKLKFRMKNYLITQTPNFRNFSGPYNNAHTLKAGGDIKRINGNSNSKISFQVNEWIVLNRGEEKAGFFFSKTGDLFFNGKKIVSDIVVTYSYSKDGDKIITAERIYISPSSPFNNYVLLKGCDLPENIIGGRTAMCWALYLIDGREKSMRRTFGGKYGPENIVSWSPNEDYAIVKFWNEGIGYCRINLKTADSVCWWVK